ncbi:transmembrane emp24 domain-containing protein 10-like [Podarcis muralis]|uniref:Transmembrane emp24 domain-containing protein 10-like n=2 Tax=Podarcis TaxID=42163 RepID=A0A670JIQ8_PODMU|nr:transmembrane emp24 domain-containing protein 10-like [Podarcis muralis]XP_053224547.1 transmembrane emp24 domain-containing protein 10-like [Podarcis raffonei]CAI5798022.1 emp24 domain-containing 10-like [Podarcis lilfordi]
MWVPGLLGPLALLAFSAGGCQGLSFQLPPQTRKCLKEELHRDVMVTGEFVVSEATAPGIRTDLRVTDSSGHLLYSRDDAKKGKFAFTTDDYEIYEICFESHGQPGNFRVPDQLITLNIKHGVEARNYEDIAKAEKLKPLEVDLRRLEDLSESIVKDFAFMKQREEEMRDTNESTSARVFYFSIFSMLCLVGLATWQVFYLRRFFKAKKLIE